MNRPFYKKEYECKALFLSCCEINTTVYLSNVNITFVVMKKWVYLIITLVLVKLAVAQNIDTIRNQISPSSPQSFDSPTEEASMTASETVTIDSSAVNSPNDEYWLNLSFVKDWKFADSLAKDTMKRFTGGFSFQLPTQKIAFDPDPFNPYNHEEFTRITRYKTWYLWVTLIILIYFVYFKSVFPKQFQLRMGSFIRNYHFEDLMNEQKISSAAGSLHANAFGTLVFVQGVILFLLTQNLTKINNIYIFLIALVITSIGTFIIYFLQWVFTSSMDLNELLSRQIQRQINVNLLLGLFFIPLFLLLYYNSDNQSAIWIMGNLQYVLLGWILLRIWAQIRGLFQDRVLNFTSILYFCTLEIFPYALLVKYIYSII